MKLQVMRDTVVIVFSAIILGTSYGKWVSEPTYYLLLSWAGVLVVLTIANVALLLKKAKRIRYFYFNSFFQILPSAALLAAVRLFGATFFLTSIAIIVGSIFLDILILVTLTEKKKWELMQPLTPRMSRDPLLFEGMILCSTLVLAILFFLSIRYAIYAAIALISIVSVAVGFALFDNDSSKLLAGLAGHVTFMVPFFVVYWRYSSWENLIVLVGFGFVSATAVILAAILADELLLGSPLFRIFQVSKRLLKARLMRYALSLSSIVTYAAGITVLGSAMPPYAWLIFSGILVCNVAITIFGNVRERGKEIFAMATVGLNPDHFSGLFLAEAFTMGFIGGGAGYVAGLYALILASLPVTMFELSAGWTVMVILSSTAIAVMAAVLPALKASMLATPSLLRRWWLQEPQFFGWPPTLAFKIPLDLTRGNAEEFLNFFVIYLRNLEIISYNNERIDELNICKHAGDKRTTSRLTFKYFLGDPSNPTLMADNDLRLSENPETSRVEAEVTIKALKQATPSYQHLRHLASAYRRMAMEWTLMRTKASRVKREENQEHIRIK